MGLAHVPSSGEFFSSHFSAILARPSREMCRNRCDVDDVGDVDDYVYDGDDDEEQVIMVDKKKHLTWLWVCKSLGDAREATHLREHGGAAKGGLSLADHLFPLQPKHIQPHTSLLPPYNTSAAFLEGANLIPAHSAKNCQMFSKLQYILIIYIKSLVLYLRIYMYPMDLNCQRRNVLPGGRSTKQMGNDVWKEVIIQKKGKWKEVIIPPKKRKVKGGDNPLLTSCRPSSPLSAASRPSNLPLKTNICQEVQSNLSQIP